VLTQAGRASCPFQCPGAWAAEEQQRGGGLCRSGCCTSDLLSTTLAEVGVCCVRHGVAAGAKVRLDSIGRANAPAVLVTTVV